MEIEGGRVLQSELSPEEGRAETDCVERAESLQCNIESRSSWAHGLLQHEHVGCHGVGPTCMMGVCIECAQTMDSGKFYSTIDVVL